MKIEINPRSLLNLEHIVEVLYKLHPSTLNYLVGSERSLGGILGEIDLSNPSLQEREFLSVNFQEENINGKNETKSDDEENIKGKNETESDDDDDEIICGNINDILNTAKVKYASDFLADGTPVFKEKLSEEFKKIVSIESLQKQLEEEKAERREERFHKLRKYLQLDTYEYIPMKIFVEIDDPVVGRKVKELVAALEKTRAPEQFYLHKREIDENAYFAEGYGLKMNKEQKMKFNKFFWTADADALENLLIKEKLYT